MGDALLMKPVDDDSDGARERESREGAGVWRPSEETAEHEGGPQKDEKAEKKHRSGFVSDTDKAGPVYMNLLDVIFQRDKNSKWFRDLAQYPAFGKLPSG
jgi:hypothetical protein